MNQEQCLKQNIIHIRSAVALRGFRWEKRLFKLYHDRIVYLSASGDNVLGSIQLGSITAVIDYSSERECNRFDIILGKYRMYQLLSTTQSIAIDWCLVVRSSISKYSSRERQLTLKHELNTFWHICGGYGGGSVCNKFSPQELPSYNAVETSLDAEDMKKKKESHKRRLSVMNTHLASGISKYSLFGSFGRFAPFGVVGIVSYEDIESPLLLQVCSRTAPNYSLALSVMDRMGDLINPYIITQLQRGQTKSLSFACYNCPSMGCLTNLLHLFGCISCASLRIICAEILCGLEYLHASNFNLPNLSPHSIYISHQSHCVLTDFGFAIPNHKDNPIYRSGPLCYAPPEFLTNAIDDIKSDWWRLGVLMYHLLLGKPPFVGTQSDICHQICHKTIQFDHMNPRCCDTNPTVQDLIIALLCRDRKQRIAVQSSSKHMPKHRMQLELIMSHPFFECISNKKNKDYPYTWHHIRQREHKPAPILCHLAGRPSYVMHNIMDTEMNDDADSYPREGSIIDTTDDEEFIVSDIDDELDDEKQSHSNTQTTPSDEHYLYSNDPQNSSVSANSGPYMPSPQSFSPKELMTQQPQQTQHAMFGNPFNAKPNNGFAPLPQSGSAQIQVNNASATPPPSASNNPFFKPSPPSPIGVGIIGGGGKREALTPMSAKFGKKQKPKVLPVHRKRLSNRLGSPGGKTLPPAPGTAPTHAHAHAQPQLNQSQVMTQEYDRNRPEVDADSEYDHRFTTYVQHQQSQMGINQSMIPHPSQNRQQTPIKIKPKPQNRILGGYAVAPTTQNLPGYHDPKNIDDASTVVSDQIAAAAALRHPILSQKEREKEKKKKRKTKKKKHKEVDTFNRRNMTDDEIHKKQAKTLPQIQSAKKPARKKGLDAIIKAKADALLNKKIRSKVSKKKRRFIDKVHGFNLDLTYITKRIIAMGYPAEGNEAVYRNPTDEVKRFFNTYHKAKFKVYNLCIEKDRQYPDSKFSDIGGKVARYQFKDHNAPELELVLRFCEDLQEWFSEDKKNVAAIHCKAGKGRTGVMICSYLAYARICKDAADALKKYGMARTKNAKGVTIPSQRRWVLYFIDYVMNPKICPSPKQFDFYKVVTLKTIRMHTIPDFDIGGGCDPYFTILNIKGEVLYDYSEHYPIIAYKKSSKKRKKKSTFLNQKEDVLPLDVVQFNHSDIVLRGAFKIMFYDKDKMSKDDVMCWCWFHSAISLRQKYIKLELEDIDGAVKDKANKYFAKEFALEFWFEAPLEEHEVPNEPQLSDWIAQSKARVHKRKKAKHRTHTHSAVPPPPTRITRSNNKNQQSNNNLCCDYGNEITYPSATAQTENPVINRTQTQPIYPIKPQLDKRSSEKQPHLDPWKKKLGKRFENKRNSASNVIQNENEMNQSNPNEHEKTKRRRHKRQKANNNKPSAMPEMRRSKTAATNTLTEYHNTTSISPPPHLTAAPQEEDYGDMQIQRTQTSPLGMQQRLHNEAEYPTQNNSNKRHGRNKSALDHPNQRHHNQNRQRQRDRKNTEHKWNAANGAQPDNNIRQKRKAKRRTKPKMSLMNHKSAGSGHQRAKTGNTPRLNLMNHKSAGGNNNHSRNHSAMKPNKMTKMHSANTPQQTGLRLQNNSNHNRNMSANSADQYRGNTTNFRNKHKHPVSPIAEDQSTQHLHHNRSNQVRSPQTAPPNNHNNQNRNPYNTQQNQYNNQRNMNQFNQKQFQATNRVDPRNQYPNQYITNTTQSCNNNKTQKQYGKHPQQQQYNNNNNQNRSTQHPSRNKYNQSQHMPQQQQQQHNNNYNKMRNVHQRNQYNQPQPNPYNNNNRSQQQQHQYHDGTPVQPPSFVNSSMMDTLRQNMEHHFNRRASPNYDSDPYDDDSNRKTTVL